MAHNIEANLLGTEVSFEFDAPWATYWIVFMRIITGYWMMHAGLTKLMEGWFAFDATWFLTGAARGTVVAPILLWFGQNAPGFVNVMIPIGEFLIGLGVLLGAFTRLAAFWGAFLMAFFYFVNHGWGHGMVSGDLWGLLAFITVAVFGAGRVFGVDQYLEQTNWVQQNRWARYILG